MEVVALVFGLIGAVIGSVAGELFKNRRAYRAARVRLWAEMVRNATWIESAKAAPDEFRERMFAPGWLRTRAWDEEQASLLPRFEMKSVALLGEIQATYAVLEPMSVQGLEPPDAVVRDLWELTNRLNRFDVPLRVKLLVFLLRRRWLSSSALWLGQWMGDTEQLRIGRRELHGAATGQNHEEGV